MERRTLIKAGALSIAGVFTSQQWNAAADDTSPNIVLIMTDDQGQWALGCYGNDEIQTPNIDQLAEDGVRFTNSYCTSPVCSPSRATFMTGLIPSQHGIHDWIHEENQGERSRSLVSRFTTVTDVLHNNNYECALSGKWHLGDNITPFRYHDFWFTIPTGGSSYQNAKAGFNGESIETEGYLTERITDYAIRFIEKDHSKPFFLNIQYTAPHGPWSGHPQRYQDLYRDCEFNTLPDEPRHSWASAYLNHYGNRDTLVQYFASISAVDHEVGRIMESLKQNGMYENTIIIFMSDHGFQCGHNGLFGKGNCSNPRNMYEESVLIPTIVHAPSLLSLSEKNMVCNDYINGYDLMPTILNMANTKMPDGNYAGKSFIPLLQGQQSNWENAAYAEYGRARMIRTPDWKYVHRADGGPNEFYNMQTDPLENLNLADDPKYIEEKRALRKQLFSWFAKYAEGDADPVGNEYLRPDMK